MLGRYLDTLHRYVLVALCHRSALRTKLPGEVRSALTSVRILS
ncbi:hypothetical protein CORC01_04315 [Colletotrichum orchidophilum]|uniref:Uncharacterized protein n=1 Tax=Colletotrichum orchidophilum TaxID=1209926 RepID=A0A1G4BG14_9PEZI|nr:uncharacterized protein CORC01_04315 [Colletotrichum orchidophilum]OHF00334.1 hypothetical protein CORC01_04315 [Colletotrichum orchidophilum]